VAHGHDFEYRTAGREEFHFSQCGSCGIILLDPRPVDDAIAQLYPANYEPYLFHKLNPVTRLARLIVQREKVRSLRRYCGPGSLVVDVGCGNGALLRSMARSTSHVRLLGWDYPGPHLDELRRTGIAVIAAPIDDLSAPADVDLFILNQVIEHLPRPDRILQLLASRLRPGGHIFIETPDTRGLDAKLFGKRYWGGYHIPRHMVLFTSTNLTLLAERCGLSVVETRSLASPAFWVQSLHHLLSESRLAVLAPMCSLRNVPLLATATLFDRFRTMFGPTSNQRLVVRAGGI
jgi:2-polyprenyl-3-methyl-5-hydroxy-6-metoxy-1,4-benzoquinol methylase